MNRFALALLSSLIGATGAQRAQAETIATFTGSWQLQSDSIAFREMQSIPQLEGPISSTLTGRLGLEGLVSNFVDEGSGCSVDLHPCTETWSGDLAGTMYFVAYSALGGQYSFAGAITDGSFSGERFCDFDECLGENRIMFRFVSTGLGAPGYADAPTHGRSSEGTFSVNSCVGNCGPISIGTLTMTTTAVPEPGSMTLLGAGFVAGAGALRRRRSARPR